MFKIFKGFCSFINIYLNLKHMKFKNKIVMVGAIILYMSCATNPFTGNKTLALVPNSEIFPTSFAQYDQFLKENKVVKNTANAEMIARVGKRISEASERWLDANGYKAI